MKEVYIVVNLECGWDNVVAVYPGDIALAEIEKAYPKDAKYGLYHIFHMRVQSKEELQDDIEEALAMAEED